MGDKERFPFEVGDTVLVRVRERGDSGRIVAKFEGVCHSFSEGVGRSAFANISLPWGLNNRVSLRYYEAEFEVVGKLEAGGYDMFAMNEAKNPIPGLDHATFDDEPGTDGAND